MLAISAGVPHALVLPTFALVAIPIVWGLLLLLGSFSCLLGVVTRTWVGEYIGLAPLAVCIVSLGFAQIISGMPISGAILLGLVGFLLYRFYLVSAERAHSIRRNKEYQSWYDRAGSR